MRIRCVDKPKELQGEPGQCDDRPYPTPDQPALHQRDMAGAGILSG